MRQLLIGWLLVGTCCIGPALATEPTSGQTHENVFKMSTEQPLQPLLKRLRHEIGEAGFAVMDEIPILANISGMADRWGDDFNRNGFDAIVALVICNGWYVNQVSNRDPDLLGLCPLHLTVLHKDGTSSVLFNRPSSIAPASPAQPLLRELERDVSAAVSRALGPE
jgi:hypothetical protein